ncbi:MAG: hypothetical protein ACE5EE_10115 [Fidelibacterota bacterium]
MSDEKPDYEYLEEEDWNPDYKPSSEEGEQAEADTVTPPLKTEDTVEPPQEEAESSSGSEKTPPQEAAGTESGEPSEEAPPAESSGEEFKGVKVGNKVYPDWDAVGAAYENLEQKLGEQSNLIGSQKQRIAELEKSVPQETVDVTGVSDKDTEPDWDPYDKEAQRQWLAWESRRQQRVEEQKRIQTEQAALAEKQKAAIQSAQEFVKSHSDLTLSQMMEVDQLVADGGYQDREAAYLEWKKRQNGESITPSGKKEKMDESEKVPPDLSDGGGGAPTEITGEYIDRMTDKDPSFPETLSEATRLKWLAGDI